MQLWWRQKSFDKGFKAGHRYNQLAWETKYKQLKKDHKELQKVHVDIQKKITNREERIKSRESQLQLAQNTYRDQLAKLKGTKLFVKTFFHKNIQGIVGFLSSFDGHMEDLEISYDKVDKLIQGGKR